MEILNSIWPILLGCVLTAIGTYIGFIHGLRIKVALLELRVEKNEQRLDRKSAMLDSFKDNIAEIKSDFKDDMTELKGDFKDDMTELKGDFYSLKEDFSELRGEIKSLVKALNVEEDSK